MNAQYKRPQQRLHRDFFYLDDEVTINSLSALESGRVDEIVSKTTTAREGGFSGDVAIPVVKASVGGSRKSSSEIEEEMVRTRTRFSVFNAWYQLMSEKKALGAFEGWGVNALEVLRLVILSNFEPSCLWVLSKRCSDCTYGLLNKRKR